MRPFLRTLARKAFSRSGGQVDILTRCSTAALGQRSMHTGQAYQQERSGHVSALGFCDLLASGFLHFELALARIFIGA